MGVFPSERYQKQCRIHDNPPPPGCIPICVVASCKGSHPVQQYYNFTPPPFSYVYLYLILSRLYMGRDKIFEIYLYVSPYIESPQYRLFDVQGD